MNDERNESIFIYIILFVLLMVFLLTSVFKEEVPVYEKIETTKNVENSVESVEKCDEEETTQPQYIEKEMIITAYCSCSKCTDGDGITASGTKATQGRTIAVDPRYIPYGTEIIIDGHSYIAEDCGGVIKGDRLDIFFDSHEEALNFGKQTKIVLIKLNEV